MRREQPSTPSRGFERRARFALAGLFWAAICAPEVVRAEPAFTTPPATFVYATPADKNYLRALLEVSVVLSVGLVWYVTRGDANYELNYQWPVFRKKLTGEALELDLNHFGTNFIGHPIGGTAYYVMARGNRLEIYEAAAITLGGSLVWEYFGEVSEIVSLNDMIVTPLAGIAIGEAFTQLGAFFDRSSPTLAHRILGVVFAPIKSLNDLFDGRELARARDPDESGFPKDEWHCFDLYTGGAMTWRRPVDGEAVGSGEWRFSLASQLARLPAYDGAAQDALVFTDANTSSLELAGAVSSDGLVDFDFASSIVLAGHYARDAQLRSRGDLWGHGLQIGWSLGFQFTVHDYDRDDSGPLDRIASVAPLGVLFEHRGAFGALRLRTRIEGSGDFGGVTPYALRAHRQQRDELELPELLREHGYYFGIGGRIAVLFSVAVGVFEVAAKLRYEGFEAVDSALPLSDQRSMLQARLSCGIPGSATRVAAVVERRGRSSKIEQTHAERSELGIALEIGATL